MTLLDSRPVPAPVPVRYAVTGLLAALDSHLDGSLPLHRLAHELRVRVDDLAHLRPPARTLTRLRWLRRDVSRLASASRAGGLGPDERAHLAATLDALRDILTALLPDPLDPAGAARPAVRDAPGTPPGVSRASEVSGGAGASDSVGGTGPVGAVRGSGSPGLAGGAGAVSGEIVPGAARGFADERPPAA